LSESNFHVWKNKNLRVAWTREGERNSSGISIVLIHGFGACKEHWRNNQVCFGAIAPCYAIDLIGFGESSQPKSALKNDKKKEDDFIYCFENWSRQIVDFCNEVIKTPVLLIGNSIGGVIALRTSQLLKQQCKGVILIDCAQRTMDDKRLREQPIGMRLTRPLLKSLVSQRVFSKIIFSIIAKEYFIEKVLEIAYPSGNNLNQDLIDILYKPTIRAAAPEAFRGFINLFNDYLAPELMENLQVPVDLIWGELDPWEPLEEAKRWYSSIACIRSLEIISKSGHCPHDENPEVVNPLIIKIIQQAT
tara:strand:- start:752 stop:1663 length:912 start_codon:yes stop_codon:yes gene_type:complete